ncbi:hypothetical protein [Ignatzschineria sp. LJL83]
MKAVLRELQAFTKRDLQEYRLQDYFALSRGARWCVLSVVMPCMLLLLFFLWRYVWGAELLEAHIVPQQKVAQQLQAIQKEIDSHQQFVTVAEAINLLDVVNDTSLEKQPFSEVDLIHQVETLLLESGLTQLALRPQKREVIFPGKRERQRSEDFPLLPSELTTSLISMKPIGRSHQVSIENISDAQKVINLELELSICGQYSQLFLFLTLLEQLSPVFYVERLSVVEKEISCSVQALERVNAYNLVLQFYDLPTLHHAYQFFLEGEKSSLVSGFPRTMTDIQNYLNYWNPQSHQSHSLVNNPDDLFQSLRVLFQSFTTEKEAISPFDMAPKSESVHSENLYRWHMGEMYQGMRLVGIVMQEVRPFAIIEHRDRRWEKVSVGEHHIIRMKSHYLELQLPILENKQIR